MNSFGRFPGLSVLIISAGFICAGSTVHAGPMPQAAAETVASETGGKAVNPGVGTITSYKYRNLFPDVVARVNGKTISGRELEKAVLGEMASMGNPEWKNLREDYRGNLVYNLITRLINTALMYEEAVSSGIQVSDAEVQDEYLRISQTFKNDEEMKSFLADQDISSDQMIENIHKGLMVSKYVDEVVGSTVTLTPEELKEFYSKNPDQFRHPDLVRTSHIQVDAGINRKEDELALKRIENLMARVEKGEDFAALAREHSTSPSAVRGGDIGFTSEEMVPPEYAAAAFSLPVGGTQIVRTEEGYFIVKVTDKKKEGTATFEESRDQIAEFLKNQKTDKELQKRINRLRDAADIEILIPAGVPLEP